MAKMRCTPVKPPDVIDYDDAMWCGNCIEVSALPVDARAEFEHRFKDFIVTRLLEYVDIPKAFANRGLNPDDYKLMYSSQYKSLYISVDVYPDWVAGIVLIDDLDKGSVIEISNFKEDGEPVIHEMVSLLYFEGQGFHISDSDNTVSYKFTPQNNYFEAILED